MPPTKKGLLLVDDKPSIRASISHLFAETGYSVRSARDGFPAVRELRVEIRDILISDLNMPGMSGFELLRVVRRLFPEIQLIAMSGAFRGDEVPSGVAADAFYQKGSSTAALFRIIELLPFVARREPPRDRGAAPLLIRGNVLDTTKGPSITIACPECLRTFPQPHSDRDSSERITTCFHCDSSIQYVVVEPFDQMAPQFSYRRVGAGISALSASDVGD
jgi:CheY-like chemotaxis protein